MWEVVEAVLAMTDSGFESWGGVYTCGHGANGQLGRPCDAITSELSGDACDLRAAGSRIVSGGWHNNDNEARSNTRDRHIDKRSAWQDNKLETKMEIADKIIVPFSEWCQELEQLALCVLQPRNGYSYENFPALAGSTPSIPKAAQ